jgi:filamentous hemagglutinin family protein
MSNTAPLTRRNRLLTSCAVAAVAAVTAQAPVRAQAVSGGFQGTPSVDPSRFDVTQGGSTTRVEVRANRAIINWTPFDNASSSSPIDFLPQGQNADFVNATNRFGADYIVLNRIIGTPNRPIAFNGAVRSTLSSIAGEGAPGGQVWFYSPSGILVGATGSFNVGSLLLTAADPTGADGERFNNFLNGSNDFNFAAAPGSTAAVEVQGNISALGQNAYVALIAPRVLQSGSVRVDGSAAYVAGEQVDMTINGTLFNISVPVGSTVGGGRTEDAALVHDGETQLETGYGSDPGPRQAVLVAVPKNDAVTMLVQGTFGYTVAANASVSDNKIILSGGRNVTAGAIDTSSGDPAKRANVIISNAQVDGTLRTTGFGSAVEADATGAVSVRSANTNTSNPSGMLVPDILFSAGASLSGANGAVVDAGANSRIRVVGDLSLASRGNEASAPAPVRLSSASGATLSVTGSASLTGDMQAAGFASGDGATVSNNRIVEIAARGGDIGIGGNVLLSASGSGGGGSNAGGAGTGGVARIVNSGAGTIAIGGFADLEANGRGGFGSGGAGGNGTGGTVSVEASLGRIQIAGGLEMDARGSGENGYGAGGAGQGGTVRIATSGTGQIALNTNPDLFGGTFLDAGGRGGSGSIGAGGTGTGGTASIDVAGGSLATGGSTGVFADAEGGESSYGTGGFAQGGTAFVRATAGTISLGDSVEISAVGGNPFGGEGSSAIGGDGRGGTARLEAVGGAISIAGSAELNAFGAGGFGGTGGLGEGGTASVLAAGSSLTVNGDLSLNAYGLGGLSFDREMGYGDGIGGTAQLQVTTVAGQVGSLSAGAILLDAGGRGGATRSTPTFLLAANAAGAGGGGDGQGGTVDVLVDGDLTADNLVLDASGAGGDGANADFGTPTVTDGSDGRGGTATIEFRSGAVAIGTNPDARGGLRIDVSGGGGRGGFDFRGNGGAGASGGDGVGGVATLKVSGGAPQIASVDIQADGRGGSGASGTENGYGAGGAGGHGGLGDGGAIAIEVSGGTLNLDARTYSASGFGGLGGAGGSGRDAGGAGGAGGAGIGGQVTVNATGGELNSLTILQGEGGESIFGPSFIASGIGAEGGDGGGLFGSTGRAGAGGQGGAGTGGAVSFAADNTTVNLGPLSFNSSASGGRGGRGGSAGFGGGTGGNGGRGGAATGGSATLKLDTIGGGSVTLFGTQPITLSAAITGGQGGIGGEGARGGNSQSGDGGAAIVGGSIDIELAGSFDLSVGFDTDVAARGGDGGIGSAGETGYGMEGAAGGSGGDAQAGVIRLTVADGDLTLPSGTAFNAIGTGGAGGTSANRAGGNGGKGGGGTLAVNVTGGTLTAPALRLLADGVGGQGGNGGDNLRGGNGGRGGDATGGTVTVGTALAGRLVTRPAGGGRGLEAHADARAGTGGNGGNGFDVGDTGGRGGNAGNAEGGSVSLEVAGGAMDLGDVKITANAWGGGSSSGGVGAGRAAIPDSNPNDGIDDSQPAIPPTFAPGGSDGTGAAGSVTIQVADAETGEAGSVRAGSVSLRASGRRGDGSFDAAGTIRILESAAAETGSFVIDSLEARAMGFNGESTLGFELTTDGGRIDILNGAFVETDKDAVLRGTGTGALALGADLTLLAGGNVDLIQDAGATPFLITAQNININAGSVTSTPNAALSARQDISVSAGSIQLGRLQAGRDILLGAFGQIDVASATAGDDVEAESGYGAVTVLSAAVDGTGEDLPESGYGPGDGSNIRLTGSGEVRLDDGDAVDVIALDSNGASVRSAGLLRANRLDVQAAADIALNDVEVVQTLSLNAFGGSVSGNRFLSQGDIFVFGRDGIGIAALDANNFINLNSSFGDVIVGSARTRALGGEGGSDGGITVSGGLVTLGEAVTPGFIEVNGTGFDGETLTAGRFIRIQISTESGYGGPVLLAAAPGSIELGTAAAGDFVSLSAPGAITAGTVTAGTDLAASGSSIALTSGTAGRDILLDADNDITVGTAQAGDDVEATSRFAAVTVGSGRTTGLGEDISESGYGPGDGSNIRLSGAGDVRLDNGDAADLIALSSTGGNVNSAGLLRADTLDVQTSNDIDLTDVTVVNSLTLTTTGGFIRGRTFRSDGSITLDAEVSFSQGDRVDVGTIAAGGALFVEGIGIGIGSASGAGVIIVGDGAIDVGTATSTAGLEINGRGDVAIGTATGAGFVELNSGNNLQVASATGGSMDINARFDTTVGTATATGLLEINGGADTVVTSANAGGVLEINARFDTTVGSATAGTILEINAGANTRVETATAGTGLFTNARFDNTIGTAISGGAAEHNAGGALTLGTVRAAGSLEATAGGAIDIGTFAAGTFGLIDSSGGDVTVDFATAGGELRVNAARFRETAANLTLAEAEAGQTIRLDASGEIRTGTLRAGDDILAQGATITLTNGTAGRDVLATSPGAIAIGRAQAGDDIVLTSNGAGIDAGTLLTTGLGFDGTDLGGEGSTPPDGSNIRLTGVGDIRLDNGEAIDLIALASSEGDVNSAALLKAADLSASSSGDIALTDLDIANGIGLFASNGSITGRDFRSGFDINLQAADAVNVAALRARRNIFVQANGIDIGSATTIEVGGEGGGGIRLDGFGLVTLGTGNSAGFIDVTGRGFDGGALTAGSFVRVQISDESGYGNNVRALAAAPGAISLDSADAGTFVLLSAPGAVDAGTVTAGESIFAGGTSIAVANATAGTDILLGAVEDISIGQGQAGDDIEAESSFGTVTAGRLATTGLGLDQSESGYGPGDGSNIRLSGAGDVGLDDGQAIDLIALASSEANVNSATLLKATDLTVASAGNIALADVELTNALTLDAQNGTITGADFLSGALIDLAASGDVDVDSLTATGSVDVDAVNVTLGSIRAGTVAVQARGRLTTGDVTASTGGLALAGATGTLQTGNLLALSTIDLDAGGGTLATGNITSQTAAVDLATTGAMTLGDVRAGGGIALAGGGRIGAGSLTAGTLASSGGGDIRVANNVTGNTAEIQLGALTGRGVSVTGAGQVTTGNIDAARNVALAGTAVTAGIARAGGDLNATAGRVTIAEARAGDDITIRADDTAVIGAVATTGLGADSEANGFRVDIEAANDVSFGAAIAAGDLRVVSRNGGLPRLGAPTVANVVEAGGSILLGAARDLTADSLVAGGSVTLNSTGGSVAARRIDAKGAVGLSAQNGSVTVSQDLIAGQPVTASARAVTLNAIGALSVANATATAGNVALASGGNLTLGSADASGSVSASSGGTLGINGTVGGAQISLASRDIAIGANAQVGTAARTTALQITANGGTAVLGGSGGGSGYRLDNAEFGRLAAQNVTVSARGSGPVLTASLQPVAAETQPDNAVLRVETLNVRQAAVTRSLNLTSSGDVEMVGRLAYENAGADDAVRVSAARAFTADTAGAGIAVTNGQGALTGSIDIDARSITVASAQARTDLGSAANIAARDARLGTVNGAVDEAGFLQAGGIRLAASERIFVQNSGLSSEPGDDRRGLTAGAGGITLVTKGTGPVEIIINGRQEDGAGGFTVGEALIDRLTITGENGGPATFAQGSTVNGCIIGGNNCAPVALVEPLVAPRDLIEELEEQDVFAPPPVIGFFQLITTEGGPILPVIDDPVTGTGNDDLAIGFGAEPEDGRVTDRDAVDQPVTGTGNEALQGGTGPLINIDNSQRDREEQSNAPVTGTGNEALQGGQTPPTPEGDRPGTQPDVDGPVTGAGNEDLQDGPNG